MVKQTKVASKFKLLCMSKGYRAQDISRLVKERTGEEISVSTIYAYFQDQRFPTRKNMDALVGVLGNEVLECFYERKGE